MTSKSTGNRLRVLGICLMLLPLAGWAQDKGQIVEEVVARVNNDAITRGDMEHAAAQMRDEIRQDCPTCTPDEVKQKAAQQDKNILRDLIDSSLLVQRAKDLDITEDTELVKRLDEIRIQNNIDSLEDLERQVTKSGLDYEDFKNGIRNQLLQQEVIKREVGSKVILAHSEMQQYYDAHKQEFVRPEQVVLREIFVSTDGKPESEIPELRKKADSLLERVKGGEDFGELAKRFSDGSTAKDGGDLGTFEHGQLAANLEAAVFKLNHDDVTDVAAVSKPAGFLILQVREHYAAGQQPEDKVENEIESKLYAQKMEPALRQYLATLRADSYVEVKPGYVDTAAVSATTIDEVPPTPDDSGKKRKSHKSDPLEIQRGMKPAYVADLAPDTGITTFLLVGEKELRVTREGKPFLRLELSDCTGSIEARIWENVEYVTGTFDRDDIIKIQGRVESYRNKIQLAIDKLRRAEPNEIDLADYFPHTAEDVEKLYARLREHAAAVSSLWLRGLLLGIIEDPTVMPRLKRAPAAKIMHHAFLGGLLEHMVSLCDLCCLVAGHYPELDADLLSTGAILHDLGKLDELCYERAINYTTEGQLLGHIVLELEQIIRRMDAIEGFPPSLKTLIKHLVISHHGQYEFGSPKLPMFREALVLHYLDDLDSKMGAARAALGMPGGENEWTGYSPALNRRLLRLDLFRPPESAVGVLASLSLQQELKLDASPDNMSDHTANGALSGNAEVGAPSDAGVPQKATEERTGKTSGNG